MPLVTWAEAVELLMAEALTVCPASATFWLLPRRGEQPAAANAAATASVPDRRGSARRRNLPGISPAHAAALPGVRLSAMFMTESLSVGSGAASTKAPPTAACACLAGPEPNQVPSGGPGSSRSLKDHVSRAAENTKN